MNLPYWTKTTGTGGSVQREEDFVVDEVIDPKFLRSFERTRRGVKRIEGPYTLYVLRKRGTTTASAIKIVSKELGVKERGIGYAGLKDKFAITTQHVTIKGTEKEVETENLTLKKIGKTNKHISVGDLIGNSFEITLRGCRDKQAVTDTVSELGERGLPNYFGPQRFGRDGENHAIGGMLVKRDFPAALEAINRMYGKNCGGLKEIPKPRLKFFIHAYQSWIFNCALAEYVASNRKPLLSAVPIFGYDTNLKNSRIENSTKKIIRKEGLKGEDFRIRELNLACAGGRRDAFIKAGGIRYKIGDNIRLSFTLPRGGYATTLIREVTKNGP